MKYLILITYLFSILFFSGCVQGELDDNSKSVISGEETETTTDTTNTNEQDETSIPTQPGIISISGPEASNTATNLFSISCSNISNIYLGTDVPTTSSTWVECNSTVPVTVSGTGTQSFDIYTKDEKDNISKVGSKTISIDSELPSASLDTSTITGVIPGGSNVTINFTGSDSLSGIKKIVISYSHNGINFSEIGNVSGTDTSLAWSVPPDNTIKAQIRVTSFDNAGNSFSVTSPDFIIDSTGPAISIDPISPIIVANSINHITYTVTEGGGATTNITLQYAHDGTNFVDVSTTLVGTTSYDWTAPATIATEAKFKIKATNISNITTELESNAFQIDLTGAPTATFADTLIATLNQATSFSPDILNENGSPITNCELKSGSINFASWPAGLTIDSMTCEISGTVSVAVGPIPFIFEITNAIGTNEIVVNLRSDLPPVFATITNRLTAKKNTSSVINLESATDPDDDTITYSIHKAPSKGTLTNCLAETTDLTCDFIPTTGMSGEDFFVYKAVDVHGGITLHYIQILIYGGIADASFIASGTNHTCIIQDEGKVKCWGLNTYGQLGYGNTESVGNNNPINAVEYVSVDTTRKVTYIAASIRRTCVILDDGNVKCWGSGSSYGLGQNSSANIGDNELPSDSSTTVDLQGNKAVQISSGNYHSCALLEDGRVMCWGSGSYGALGDDDSTSNPVPNYVFGASNAVKIDTGSIQSCLMRVDGTMSCWGYNNYGQLGYGSTENIDEVRYDVSLASPGTAIDFAVAPDHTCVILSDGNVNCFGHASYGQLGYGNTTKIGDDELPSTQTPLNFGSPAVSIDVGLYFSCALLSNSEVKCWGQNTYGQLGTGTGITSASWIGRTELASSTATSIATNGTPSNLHVGEQNSFIINENGVIQSWGRNQYGELGLANQTTVGGNTAVDSTNVIKLDLTPTFSDFIELVDTTIDTPLAITLSAATANSGGTLSYTLDSQPQHGTLSNCLGGAGLNCDYTPDAGFEGFDLFGYKVTESGGNGEALRFIKIAIRGNLPIISTNANHTCMIINQGKVKCWGSPGSYGLLGYGNTNTIGDNEPLYDLPDVSLGGNAIMLNAGGNSNCALLETGDIRCWGYASAGALGNSTTATIGNSEDPSVSPVVDFDGEKAVETCGGASFNCAIVGSGHVKCWGAGSNHVLGDGSENTNTVPDRVHGTYNITKISCGSNHVCAIKENKELFCWGYELYGVTGQGDGAEVDNARGPISLDGDIKDITTGYLHTCVQLTDNSIQCFGRNSNGALGYGHTDNIGDDELPNSESPISFPANDIKLVRAGNYFTCALLDNNDVHCWGQNSYGQLANGTITKEIDATLTSPLALNSGTVVDIQLGGYHGYAVMSDGSIQAWGNGTNGVLGKGHTGDTGIFDLATDFDFLDFGSNPYPVFPTYINNLTFEKNSGANAITLEGATPAFAGALVYEIVDSPSKGTLTDCLGGTDDLNCNYTPTADASGEDFFTYKVTEVGTGNESYHHIKILIYGNTSKISAGGHAACAIIGTGRVRCWGRGYYGQLGYGNKDDIGDDESPSSAGDVDIGGVAVDIAVSSFSSYAILSDGTISSWGSASNYALGNGVNSPSIGDTELPSSVSAIDLGEKAVQISAGDYFACALMESGKVICWGEGSSGQMGDGATSDNSTPRYAQLSKVKKISVGKAHVCAIREGGNLSCWGENDYGKLGNGNTSDQNHPVGNIPLDLPVVEIASGGMHTCAILNDGSVSCWGYGNYGELGYGSTSNIYNATQKTPITFGSKTAIKITTGYYNTCVVLSDRNVRCWGNGSYGSNGQGDINKIGDNEAVTSVGVVGLLGTAVASNIYSGGTSSSYFTILSDGEVQSWGQNNYGQLGQVHTDNIGDDELPNTGSLLEIDDP